MDGREFIVVEFNQASRMPRVYNDDVHHGADGLRMAREVAAGALADATERGRRETYSVYEITEVDDDEQ